MTNALRVKSRASGDWQIKSTEGRECSEPVEEHDFWVLVDLTDSQPNYYIMPDWWIRSNIYEHHHKWLQSHGGIRPITPESDHHRVTLDRIQKWKDRWDILKLF